MAKRWSILAGGPAGQGPNTVSSVLSWALAESGYFVFASRDYESRIRGGHNFNVVTFSNSEINTNDSSFDILVALDELAYTSHKSELSKNTIVIKEPSSNIFALGQIFKILGLDFTLLDSKIKNMSNYDENLKEAKEGYSSEIRKLTIESPFEKNPKKIMNGNEALALSAIESGIDFYYAYPMTPATGLLFELASRELKNNYKTIEMEGEIAVALAACGSVIAGKVAIVGTSGGGFDLMSETLSMTGVGGIPLVFYLAQRAAPGTGVPTYNAQGDLMLALNAGHGEFPRIVAAPGDPKQAMKVLNNLLMLSHKFKVPSILLGDKHLAESIFTLNSDITLPKVISSVKWPSRFSSYVTDKYVSSTRNKREVIESADKRREKESNILKFVEKMESFVLEGNKKSRNVVIGWGSTRGAILDAIQGLNCSYLQPIYMNPFTNKLSKAILNARNIILVENNETAQLGNLIRQKTGREIPKGNIILRYDGRPFLGKELRQQISRRLK